MKVQSVNNYNYYNNYNNRSLGEKEQPKPCFQHTPRGMRKIVLPAFIGLSALAAACTKLQPPQQQDCGCNDCDTININVSSNSTSSSSSSSSASASVNIWFITQNGDTIVPTPGNDTIDPGQNGTSYFDSFDFIYGPMVQSDSTHYGPGQVFPVGPNDLNAVHTGNDTIDYATKFVETYSYHNSKDNRPHPAQKVYTLIEDETLPNKGVYNVEATYAFWDESTQQHELRTYNYKCERTKVNINGKEGIMSTNSNISDENVIQAYSVYIPGSNQTEVRRYSKDNHLLAQEKNSVEFDNDGTAYFNHHWEGGNENVLVRVLNAKKPEDFGGK